MQDLISRQDAISLIKEYERDSTCPLDYVSIIRQVPSVPRKGKWRYGNGMPATIGTSYSVICSECNLWSEYCTNFCPNCGADMRGEHDG